MSGVVSAVTSIFKSPKTPSAPTIATAPAATSNTEQVKEAARMEADKLRKRRGAASTFVTGAAGVTGQAPGQRASLG